MNAYAAARFAGGRGIAPAIQLYIVPFWAKTKMKRKVEKYLAPKESVNMKTRKPMIVIGIG